MKTARIRIEADLVVTGIYNFNRSGRADEPGASGDSNHKLAKKDRQGIDFTSSRCIRHELFKDCIPNQPILKEFKQFFVQFAASEPGMVRGYLAADDELKRYSPLHVADAYTYKLDDANKTEVAESVLFFDQGTSSKPKEKASGKNKKGEDKGDVSLFSQDNAPSRRQLLRAGINIKELQFLPMDPNYYRVVDSGSEPEYLKELQDTFRSLGAKTTDLEVSEYLGVGDVFRAKRRGVLLTDEQLRILIKSTVSRFLCIDGIKSGASLRIDASTVKIFVSDNVAERSLDIQNLDSELARISFRQFYQKAENVE